MRFFVLLRKQDVSGVSGTGLVAEGAVFSNGKVAVTWRGPVRSVTVYESLEDAMAIHCHGGATNMYWRGPDVAFVPFRDEDLITDAVAWINSGPQ